MRNRFGPKLRWLEPLAFLAMVAPPLAPIWSVERFPSQDDPSHLENAAILRGHAGPDGALLRQYYIVEPSIAPSWLVQAALVSLTRFVSPLVAEKLIVSASVVLLPLAVRYALIGVGAGSGMLAWLALPFVPNVFLHLGFYNFCHSLALFFFVIGYWIRRQDAWTLRSGAGFAALVLVTYCAHIVALVMAGLTIGCLLVWSAIGEAIEARQQGRGFRAVWRRLGHRALAPLLATMPTLALIFYDLTEQGTGTLPPAPALATASQLVQLRTLVSFGSPEAWLARIVAVAVGAAVFARAVAIARSREARRADGFALAAVAALALCFLAPDAISGGWLVNRRLTLFPWFLAILWLGARPLAPLARSGLAGLAAGIAIAMTAFHWNADRAIDAQLAEYLSASQRIEAGSTLLPLSFARAGRGADGQPLAVSVAPFLNVAGYIAAERPIVNLANWQADRDGLFPVRFRPELNPFSYLARTLGERPLHSSSLLLEPPVVDFLDYPQRTGGRVDYVLLWGLPQDAAPQDDATRSILRQLAAGYEPVHVSPQTGMARLYRRRDGF